LKIDIREVGQLSGQRNRVPLFVDGDPKRIDAAHLPLPLLLTRSDWFANLRHRIRDKRNEQRYMRNRIYEKRIAYVK
jgi:hypothetical protein